MLRTQRLADELRRTDATDPLMSDAIRAAWAHIDMARQNATDARVMTNKKHALAWPLTRDSKVWDAAEGREG